jgi:glycosyltransferase involved in cell wall biosynthesis
MSGAGTETPALSLVVCTHNRADLLEGLLGTLAAQEASRDRSEVLLVDNASTDGTAAAAGAWAPRLGLRVVREEALGLSHARNRGWREARGAYVAYVDDDCLLPPGWMRAALRVIDREAPDAFGGPSRAVFDAAPPPWFRGQYLSHDYGPDSRDLSEDEYLDGLNMAFRREHLERLGGFDPGFGMRGRTIAYGEETDLQQRLRRALPDARIRIDPALEVGHRTRADRARIAWRLRQAWANGRHARRLFPAPAAETPRGLRRLGAGLRLAGGVLADGCLRAWTRERAAYPYWQQYVWERTAPRIARLGALWEDGHRNRQTGADACAASPAS